MGEPIPSGGVELKAVVSVAAALLLLVPLAAAAQEQEPPAGTGWIRTGGPIGGLGYDVRMDPINPDRMYVTDAFAGVFVSEDGGQTWHPSNDGITTRTGASGDAIPVFSLTIDPNNPDILWIGTQDTRGIFKSTDAGLTWAEKDSGVVEVDGITFRGFGVEPGDSDTVYAAGEVSSWANGAAEQPGIEFDRTGGVVYKTTDGGDSWSAVWRGDNLARYVWIDPTDTNVLYVSTGIFDREAANSDPATRTAGGVGVMKSSDGGTTWAPVNDGIDNLYVGTLFLHPEDPDILLAGSANITYRESTGIFLSVDGGATWARTHPDEVTSVEFAASDPDIAYAASVGFVYRSEDGGRTWETVSGPGWGPPGVLAGFPIDVQVDPRNPDRLFANNYGGGNFVSNDGGRSWKVASTGYTGAQVRDLTVRSDEPGRVYAAARSGLFTAPDGGGEWTGLLSPPVSALEWNAVTIDRTDPSHLLAGTNWGGTLAESHDGGGRWSIVVNTPEGQGWRTIVFAPSNPAIVYSGTAAFHSAGSFAGELPAGGIWSSEDGGTTWEPANDALTEDASVAAIAVHPTDPTLLYAASTTHGLLRSRDGGGVWEAMGSTMAGRPARSVAIDPADPQIVLVGLNQGGVYRSTDGGESWTAQPAGLAAEAVITDLVFDPADPSIIYTADVLSGVYRSTDGGQTWTAMNEGLRTRAVTALEISADGEHLYAGTDGEGVFRFDVTGTPPPLASSIQAAGDKGGADTTVPPVTPDATASAEATTAAPVAASTADAGGLPVVLIMGVVAGLVVLAGVALTWLVRRRSG